MRGSHQVRKIMLEVFRKMWNEACYDREKGEVIAREECFILGIDQGEVLRDSRNYRQFDFEEIMKRWYSNENR